jgi:hypothetical protein
MYDSHFVPTVKVAKSLEGRITRFLRMKSFQPLVDETYG